MIKVNASASYDLSYESINSLGGFVSYVDMINDFVMLKGKGSVVETKKRAQILAGSDQIMSSWVDCHEVHWHHLQVGQGHF